MSTETLKAIIRQRDGFLCTDCGCTNAEHLKKYGYQLDVHRITPGSEYSMEGCVTLCRQCHGKKPKRRRYHNRVQSVNVERELIRKARLVAAYREIPLAEFLSETLRGPVSKALDEHERRGFVPARKPN